MIMSHNVKGNTKMGLMHIWCLTGSFLRSVWTTVRSSDALFRGFDVEFISKLSETWARRGKGC
jgi:hypothetical protein